MESIKEIFKIGKGPSSSHTMAPMKAAQMFGELYPNAVSYNVTLYGSLAATGKGHLTDEAVIEGLSKVGGNNNIEIIWKPREFLPQHPNGMKFEALDADKRIIGDKTTFSIGGGDISDTGRRDKSDVYPHNNMLDIMEYCKNNGLSFWEYVVEFEGKEVLDYMQVVWETMQDAIKRGLENEGVLKGGLYVRRRASSYYLRAKSYQGSMQRRGNTFSFALAVAEENAAGGTIVTAPTCGSCGVVPAVLYNQFINHGFSDQKIQYALATAGLIGNLIKNNASISGAEVGCQGEVGSACSMASAAGCQLFGGSIQQMEYAASMGIEHFLGLTCDPVCGLVQIPCIERNAFAAARAIDVTQYAIMSDGTHLVCFDTVVETMKQTGHDLPSIYKETSEGGLATVMKQR